MLGAVTADLGKWMSRPLHLCCNNDPGRNADASFGYVTGYDDTGQSAGNFGGGFTINAELLLLLLLLLAPLALFLRPFTTTNEDGGGFFLLLPLAAFRTELLFDDFDLDADGAMVKSRNKK
jgi:hypothetical protein